MTQTVIHLIPYDGIGGVEEAARTMSGFSSDNIDFNLRYLFPDVSSRAQRWATFNPFRFIATAIKIAIEAPDLLIVSLWRASLVGVLVKLLNRRIKLVVFIHNSADSHQTDRVITRAAAWMADTVWADSYAALATRFSKPLRRPTKIISFLAHQLEPLPEPQGDLAKAPVFAFWGRLSPQKDIARALQLFCRVRETAVDAKFRIIGPEGGEGKALRMLTQNLGLGGAVDFVGPLNIHDIRLAVQDAHFYLQTSRYEGMAMSVTEAMQMGLVPVVTPVGEIARYCLHGKNAIVLNGPNDSNEEKDVVFLTSLLKDRPRFHAMRSSAIDTWTGNPTYSNSVIAAIHELTTSLQPNPDSNV